MLKIRSQQASTFASGLTQIDMAPVDYYELELPQGWSTPVSDGR
jgi:hypothetical protein